MPEIIVRGNLTVCQLVNSRSLYKLQLFGESLTSIVDASTFEFGRVLIAHMEKRSPATLALLRMPLL